MHSVLGTWVPSALEAEEGGERVAKPRRDIGIYCDAILLIRGKKQSANSQLFVLGSEYHTVGALGIEKVRVYDDKTPIFEKLQFLISSFPRVE